MTTASEQMIISTLIGCYPTQLTQLSTILLFEIIKLEIIIKMVIDRY